MNLVLWFRFVCFPFLVWRKWKSDLKSRISWRLISRSEPTPKMYIIEFNDELPKSIRIPFIFHLFESFIAVHKLQRKLNNKKKKTKWTQLNWTDQVQRLCTANALINILLYNLKIVKKVLFFSSNELNFPKFWIYCNISADKFRFKIVSLTELKTIWMFCVSIALVKWW